MLLLFFSVYFSGHVLVSFFKPGNQVEKFGLAWLFGMQFICIEVFLLLDRTNFLVTQGNLLRLIIVNILVSVIISKIFLGTIPAISFLEIKAALLRFKNKLGRSRISQVMVLIISLLVGASLISNIYWPIYDWDALALYDFRAKVILATGDIEQGKELGYFYHYPMFTSFLHSFSYVFNFEHAKLWYTIMYVSIILVFYGVLRKNLSFDKSLIGATFITLSPLLFGHSLMAYTNLAYTIYCSLGFIYLTLWITSKNNSHLLLGSILIALSTLVRTTEPFWITSTLIILIGVIRNRNRSTLILGVISILLIMYLKEPWLLYVAKQTQAAVTSPVRTLSHITFDTSVGEFTRRIGIVTAFFFNSVIQPQRYYILAVVFGCLVIAKEKSKILLWEYLPYLAIFATILGGTFLFSYLFSEWESIPDSASRMAMILIPLHIYLIMRNPLFSNEKNHSEKKKK